MVKEEFLLFCLNTSEILEIFISNIGNLYSNKNIIEYTNFVIKKTLKLKKIRKSITLIHHSI